MADTRPTYQIASPSIRPYVQPLWPGALAMPFETRDEEGRKISLADDHLSGHYLLLAFLSVPDSDAATNLLRALAQCEGRFDAAGATILAVSASADAAAHPLGHCLLKSTVGGAEIAASFSTWKFALGG